MIEIRRNPNGDTRTAPKNVTFDQFQEANNMHIDDVGEIMYELSKMVYDAGEYHDCTKKSQERMFYRDFLSTMNEGADFIIASGINFTLEMKDIIYYLFALMM